MRKLLTNLLAVTALVCPWQSSIAAIVDSADHTFLTDTATQLDWLDVTASLGRSYDDMSSQLGVGGDFEGWQFATREQFITLLFNYTGLSVPGQHGYVLGTNDETHGLVTLMGNTCVETTCTDPYDIRYTFGWIALPTDGHQGSGNGEHAIIFDYHRYVNSASLYGYGPDYPGDGRHSPTNTTFPHLGSFLVRPTVVPVPSAAWLFGTALIGFASLGRLKKRFSHP